MITPAAGKLLIADPFLKDSHFSRSVVLLCEHTTAGSFGLTINKQIPIDPATLLETFGNDAQCIFNGGPVETDSLHFIHQHPLEIPGGTEIIKGIFWGGDIEAALQIIRDQKINTNKIRFFIGYSGWGQGQLEEELKEKTWLLSNASKDLLFSTQAPKIWQQSLINMGGDFIALANYPIDPQLN
jgi:putative transcriptional regulator